MAGERDLAVLLRGLDPHLHPGVLVWATVPAGAPVPEVDAFARITEAEGTTLVVAEPDADRLGLAHEMPSRRIEIRVRSDLAAVGLTAALAGALAAEGISANVVAAFHHDHVLVPADRAEDALATLRDLTGPAALRPATAADDMWDFLAFAGEEDDARAVPGLQRYLAGWGERPGDVGVVAIGPSGRLVGAAWCRLLVGDERDDPTFVDAATPEVVLACRPAQRGRGTGDALLAALADAARAAGHPALVLTVRDGNPALRLYLRHGYRALGTVPNRVGGASHHLLRDL
jgi:hypothetical protein